MPNAPAATFEHRRRDARAARCARGRRRSDVLVGPTSTSLHDPRHRPPGRARAASAPSAVSTSSPRSAASATNRSYRSANPSDRAAQGPLGVDAELPRDGDDREQHVADLLLGVRRARRSPPPARRPPRGAPRRRESAERHSKPHPAARRCTFAARASAGSEAGMSSSTGDRPPASSALSFSQFTSTSSAPPTSTSPNTCGWRWTSFSTSPCATSSTSHRPSSAAICAWNVDLEQQVAELVADRVVVAGIDRLEQLVGLLEQVPREGPWVCSASQGHPPGPRSRACTRTRSSRRSPPLRAGDGALGDVGERSPGAGLSSRRGRALVAVARGAVGGPLDALGVGAVHGDHRERLGVEAGRTSGSPRRRCVST